MVVPGIRFHGFLGAPIDGVAAKHPPAQAGNPDDGNKKGQAHEKPRPHPFAGQQDHDLHYRGEGGWG